MRLPLAGLVLLLALLAPRAEGADANAWRAAIDRIVLDLRGTHPAPFTRVGELEFRRAAEALKAEIDGLDEPQRLARALALVARIGDGHTGLHMTDAAQAGWYPLRLYQFSDGYFVTGAHRSVAALAGAQVLEIAGRPVEEVAAQARTLMAQENAWHGRERLFALHSATLMRGLGYAGADGSLSVKLKLANGRVETRKLAPLQGEDATFDWTFQPEYWGAVGAPADWISGFNGLDVAALRELDPKRPLHIRHRRAFFATGVPGHDAYYIQINYVGGNAQESLPVFFRRALREVDAMKPRRLILDLRYNFGGDGSNVQAVLGEFMRRGGSPPWREFYLLTGRRTFSAAVLMLSAFNDWVGPTLVGEPAGAARNHFGDANSLEYPSVGLRLYVSAERHQTGKSTGTASFMPVDYPAPFSSTDYFAGRDPAVDAILRGEERRSLTAIAVADGAQRAAQVHAERLRQLAGDKSWRAPREIDLRRAALALGDAGELDRAIEVAHLNVLINPAEWRTHYNLGDLLLKRGERAAAVQNYRASLALNDPTNFNAERLRTLIADYDVAAAAAGKIAFEKPAVVRWGATVAQLERELAPLCTQQRTRRIDPPFLSQVRERQMQIDCEGFAFFGVGRHVEFVIRDDRLVMVWIMVTVAERDALVAAMRLAHGEATPSNAEYAAFVPARAAWRHEPAEVLFYAPDMDGEVRAWFAAPR